MNNEFRESLTNKRPQATWVLKAMLGTFNHCEDYRVTGLSRNGQDC